MFRRLSEPLPLSAASLLLFRPALNAPVLNVGYLPVGPARGAVVVFAEEYGGIGVALGLRSAESGQIAVLRNQESIDFDVPVADALEPLLAEAERMGFLFDEDLLETLSGDRGRSQSMTLWAELMGGLESMLPPQLGDLEPPPELVEDEGASGPLSPSLAVAEAQYPELILDDVAPLEIAGLEDDGSAPKAIDATETLAPDLELSSVLGPVSERLPELELEDDDDSLELEHGLDEALEGALGDPLDDDWSIEDPLFGESDLTEPTTPVSAAPGSSAVPSPKAPPPEPRPLPRSAADPAPPASAARTPERPAVSTAAHPPAAPVERVDAPAMPPSATAPEDAVAPRVALSKFRQVARRGTRRGTHGRSEVGTDRSSELARIPIVRVRREREPGKRVPLLARLLSSF